jgi:ABC-type bacteriocin/lantibiotic exporter with double-glycine peptidase domain
LISALSPQFQWFARQLRPLLRSYLLGVFLIALSSLMFLLDPLLIKWLIDRVLPARNVRLLLFTAAGFFAIYICRLVFSSLANLVSFRAAQHLVFRIRLDMLQQMNRLSADYHDTTPVGDRLYRLERDVDQVAELGSSLAPAVLQATCNAVFVLGTMFVLDVRLACIVTPLLPLFFGFRRHFQAKLQRASDFAQQQSTKESSFLQEHLDYAIQVQLLNQGQMQTNAFLKRAAAKMEALNHQRLVEILFSTCYLGFIAVGIFLILAYGGHQVFAGTLTVGGLVAFYTYTAALFGPLGVAVDVYSRANRLNTNISRILEILNRAPGVQERPAATVCRTPFLGRVEMRGVSFAYPKRPALLTDFHFELTPGEKVALVGFNGSGKSTVTKLIARLYDVSEGAIYIDGTDIRDLRLESLRSRVCYLMQDTVVFDGTIKENLLLGNPAATTAELGDALRVATLDLFVRRLPNGWDTPIGPGGHALSGGERQLLALARAVLQNPSLLLLDESTGELDPATEREVFQNLIQHFPDQTILFVSHRISALEWVDRIVLLNQGVIEEQGTHDELIRMSGPYALLRKGQPINFKRFSRRDTDLAQSQI